MNLAVTQIQHFCMHDGPGLRTTVFLKGCPLRCAWCHNPETQKTTAELLYAPAQCIACASCGVCPRNAHIFTGGHTFDRARCTICGRCASACPSGALKKDSAVYPCEQILTEVLADRPFYGQTGGLTLSGGEPLYQAEGVLELLRAAKKAGISTCVDTSGYFSAEYIPALQECTDLFLWDIKDTDEKRHIAYTGVSNQKIIHNLFAADEAGIPTILRCILVKGVNLNKEHLTALLALFASLKHCRRVEFLPYHSLGSEKYALLGRPSPMHSEWVPDENDVLWAKQFFRTLGYPKKQ